MTEGKSIDNLKLHTLNRYIPILQPQNVHTLCSAPVTLASVECTSLVPQAEAICDKFERAMLLFSQCHAVFNSAQVVTVAEADSLVKLYYVCGSVTHHPFDFIGDTIGLFLAFY